MVNKIKSIARGTNFIEAEKMLTIKTAIKIILVYSPINRRAKRPEPYSTLNPETNSDSPSAKSKGLRFVSATQETHHRKARGATVMISQA